MRRKSYPFTNLQGGLDVSIDAMFLTDGASPNTNCVRLYKNRICKNVKCATSGTWTTIDFVVTEWEY